MTHGVDEVPGIRTAISIALTIAKAYADTEMGQEERAVLAVVTLLEQKVRAVTLARDAAAARRRTPPAARGLSRRTSPR